MTRPLQVLVVGSCRSVVVSFSHIAVGLKITVDSSCHKLVGYAYQKHQTQQDCCDCFSSISHFIDLCFTHNVWPLSCGRHGAYHGRPTPRNPDHHRGSIALTCSAVSFSGLLGGALQALQVLHGFLPESTASSCVSYSTGSVI